MEKNYFNIFISLKNSNSLNKFKIKTKLNHNKKNKKNDLKKNFD